MEILIILACLQIKHWIVDFALQTNTQVLGKGIYGNPAGISHSLEHVIGTLTALLIASAFVSNLSLEWIVIAAVIDGVIHYHIDWTKMNFGNRDITTPQFWRHLGLDQMLHQFCYLFLILILI
jgi:hypothetical protein